MPPAPKTLEDYTAMHLACFDEMIELGMDMARIAAARVIPQPGGKPAAPEPANRKPADPYLEFARATRVVRDAIACQARALRPAMPQAAANAATPSAATPSAPPAPPDPDRLLLRHALHDAARIEPDRAARTRLCRSIDECIDTRYRDHPDAPIEETLVDIANRLGLHLELKDLPDRLLGMPHRPNHPTPPLRRR